MENLITIEMLIKIAKDEEIDLGKGNAYNRLRYYTKMGWIPHAERKKINGTLTTLYPKNIISLLKKIQTAKDMQKSNEEISLILKKGSDDKYKRIAMLLGVLSIILAIFLLDIISRKSWPMEKIINNINVSTKD